MTQIIRDLAHIVKSSGADTVLADGYGARFAAALLSAHRVKMRAFAPTNTTINDSVGLLRTLMRDGDLILTEHDQLRKDVLTYPRVISGGTFKFGKKRGGKHHYDYASALVTMAHGLLEEQGESVMETRFKIDGTPTKKLGGQKQLIDLIGESY
jgi:hypothetical protein